MSHPEHYEEPPPPPSLPFGLNLSQIVTLGGVVVTVVGGAYLAQYRISALEKDMAEFQAVLLQQTKVTVVQEENTRLIHQLEERLDRVERRQERLMQGGKPQ